MTSMQQPVLFPPLDDDNEEEDDHRYQDYYSQKDCDVTPVIPGPFHLVDSHNKNENNRHQIPTSIHPHALGTAEDCSDHLLDHELSREEQRNHKRCHPHPTFSTTQPHLFQRRRTNDHIQKGSTNSHQDVTPSPTSTPFSAASLMSEKLAANFAALKRRKQCREIDSQQQTTQPPASADVAGHPPEPTYAHESETIPVDLMNDEELAMETALLVREEMARMQNSIAELEALLRSDGQATVDRVRRPRDHHHHGFPQVVVIKPQVGDIYHDDVDDDSADLDDEMGGGFPAFAAHPPLDLPTDALSKAWTATTTTTTDLEEHAT